MSISSIAQSTRSSQVVSVDSTFALEAEAPRDTIPTDSARKYQTAIWKMWELVHMAQQAFTADSVIAYQDHQIESQERMIARAGQLQLESDSIIDERGTRIRIIKGEGEAWKGKFQAQEAITEDVKEDVKRWKRNFWGAVAIQVLEIILILAL